MKEGCIKKAGRQIIKGKHQKKRNPAHVIRGEAQTGCPIGVRTT